MTIGIGYFGPAGVLLGSDMELTGVAKYRGSKQFRLTFNKNRGCIGAIYSGAEDDMRCVWEEFVEENIRSGPVSFTGVRNALAVALKRAITTKESKQKFQMLVGVGHPSEEFFGRENAGWRIWGTRITPAKNWEIIGSGDCELTRYLSSMMDIYPTPHQAALWVAHILNLSNSFSQNVGQGTEISWIRNTGKIERLRNHSYARRMEQAEGEISSLWADICDLDMSDEEFSQNVADCCRRLAEIRSHIPRMFKEDE
jgi:hypothetical protein